MPFNLKNTGISVTIIRISGWNWRNCVLIDLIESFWNWKDRREIFILFYKEISFFFFFLFVLWIKIGEIEFICRGGMHGGALLDSTNFQNDSSCGEPFLYLQAFSLCWLNGANDRAGVNSSLLLIWQIPLGGSEIAIEQTWKKIHPLTCLRTNSGFNTLPFLYL